MRKFFMELALGINFIHSSGVAHRDLKPEVSLDSCISFHHSVIPFLCSFNIGYSHIGCLELAFCYQLLKDLLIHTKPLPKDGNELFDSIAEEE